MEILFAAANNTGGSGCCPVLGLFQSVGVPSEAVGVPAPPVPSEGWLGWVLTEGESVSEGESVAAARSGTLDRLARVAAAPAVALAAPPTEVPTPPLVCLLGLVLMNA